MFESKLGSGNAYSFVRFLTLDMAYRAKVALSGSRIGNYQCKVGYGKTNPTARVWVGGLHYPGVASDLDESRLNDEFDRFGLIKKVRRVSRVSISPGPMVIPLWKFF